MSKDFIGYQALVDKALRGVVRDALTHAAKGGIMGGHHFNIVFATTMPGVEIPDFLLERYPEAMKIVLQHQYANLTVGPDTFEVTLTFNKVPATIVVPYTAVVAFEDPSQKFQLGFQMAMPAPKPGLPAPKELPLPADTPKTEPAPKPETGEVVSLDKFRKK
ncbi:MAG: hypothetical protein HOP13_11750 [Alphaproteobacteria bacterium]|nr:hypothetical protein [Alphaproteobacteria bacterium]